MNLKRFLLLSFLTYGACALWAFTGVQGSSDTPRIVSTPSTVTVGMLTPEQLVDRAEELATTTTTTTTIPPTTVVPAALTFKCSEWFPTAISVGWPNNPETLEKLGRLLWKETRCLNVTPLSNDEYLRNAFNGHDWGIAQVNEPVHRSYVEQVFNMPFEESMSDPTLNLRYAYILYSELEAQGQCGWQPWSLC